MLWTEKYRPKTLDELVIHNDIGERIRQLVSGGDCPHTLFYGTTGVGKMTLIHAMLHELYGDAAHQVHVTREEWELKGGKSKVKVDVTMASSQHHCQLCPSEAGLRDSLVLQQAIKNMAGAIKIHNRKQSFQVVVLAEVHELSRAAQNALRRTMEDHAKRCRLIMCCKDLSKVVEPIRSRCQCIRVPGPSQDDLQALLSKVAQEEDINLPTDLNRRIVEQSNHSIRRCLLTFQQCCAENLPLQDNQPVPKLDWEMHIQGIIEDIQNEQSPKQLSLVRGKIYQLLENCVRARDIMESLLLGLLKNINDETLAHSIVEVGAQCTLEEQQGGRSIFHIEHFIAKVMKLMSEHMLS